MAEHDDDDPLRFLDGDDWLLYLVVAVDALAMIVLLVAV